MGNYLFISEAAKEVEVESHVLRYWEEELHLPIKRNELGHRYYTQEDLERFKQIKDMKERGLQLKAIKMILKNGKLDVIEPEAGQKETELPVKEEKEKKELAIEIVDKNTSEILAESKEAKAKRLQMMIQQLIRETLQENNKELCSEIKESVIKELDYQFRMQEEREEARDRLMQKRDEEYYKRMDELLRKKSKVRFSVGKKKKGTS